MSKGFKSNFLLLFLFVVSALPRYSFGENKQFTKLFPFKSGVVEYETTYSGETLRVHKTLYIDDFGMKLCMDKRVISEKGEKKFLYIFRPDWNIAINLNVKVAVKRKNPAELFDEEVLSDWFGEILYGKRKEKIMNPRNLRGQEKILDKECSIYEEGEKRYWIWNNLILKWAKINILKTVKRIQLEVDIPKETFEIPKGVFVIPKIL